MISQKRKNKNHQGKCLNNHCIENNRMARGKFWIGGGGGRVGAYILLIVQEEIYIMEHNLTVTGKRIKKNKIKWYCRVTLDNELVILNISDSFK